MSEVKDATEEFTVVLDTAVDGDGIPSDKPTLDTPTFAIVEKLFKVTGTTPEPNQEVWIELEKFGFDEKIASGVSDGEHKFEIEIQLEEVGFNKIHSEIDKRLWTNPTSSTKSILTLNYSIIGALVLGILLVLYKIGVFNKITGGKK